MTLGIIDTLRKRFRHIRIWAYKITWQYHRSLQPPPTTTSSARAMYTASDFSSEDFYYPDGLHIYPGKSFSGNVHTTQHFRASLRISNPPHMFLDDAILAAGLTGYEPYTAEYQLQTPEQSPQYCQTCFSPEEEYEEDGEEMVLEEDVEDGTISPLELPPRLLNFDTSDGVNAGSLLLVPEPPLDLEEVDRRLEMLVEESDEELELEQSELDQRLETFARMERLQKLGFLGAFFVSALDPYPHA
ncbi:hypothetical protein NP233_g11401 [Leucocoprinus birnbaumii]|uniref:Uncharacterized protein n=1 Tax=Leucocoprinus birnbaumii TaxID=56174 RepID=A0AAD5VGH2_9AGAR|nr:hypothetical protein NP233_g11401 [Leucocoprinus birnbaumii]